MSFLPSRSEASEEEGAMRDQTTPRLLTTAAAAQILGVKPFTLQAWRGRGKGPAYVRVSANRVRYRVEALDAWVQERTVPAVRED